MRRVLQGVLGSETCCSVPVELLAKAVDALRDSGQSGVAQELLETVIGGHTPGFEMTVCRICEHPTNDDLWHCCWRK